MLTQSKPTLKSKRLKSTSKSIQQRKLTTTTSLRKLSPHKRTSHSRFNTQFNKNIHSIQSVSFTNHVSENTILDSIPSISQCTETTPRVAIIGSGPAAMYTAKYLLQSSPHLHVHIIDQLHTPYGLVRTGIAPDHPEAKNIITDFENNVLSNPRTTFIGGIHIKEVNSNKSKPLQQQEQPSQQQEEDSKQNEISFEQLYQHYHGVVIATGASAGKRLRLPGNDKYGVYDSHEFVSWYNGHPNYSNLAPRLDKVKNVVIIGNGNVSLDIARLLLAPKGYITNTDIPLGPRDMFSKSTVENVYLCGRRGVLDAAYTIAELREILTLTTTKWPELISPQSSTLEPTDNNKPYHLEFINVNIDDDDKAKMATNRALNRKTNLLFEYINKTSATIDISNSEQKAQLEQQSLERKMFGHHHQKKFSIVFQSNPAELYTIDENDQQSKNYGTLIKGIRFDYNEKESSGQYTPSKTISFSLPPGIDQPQLQQLPPDTMIITSIGYKTISLDGVPFDSKKHIYPSDKGRIIFPTSSSLPYSLSRSIVNGQIQSIDQPTTYPTTLQVNNNEQTQHQHLLQAGYNIVPFVYTSGWARRGPIGILGTNIGDAKETATSLIQDLSQWAKMSSISQPDDKDGTFTTLPGLKSPSELWSKYKMFSTTQSHWKSIQLYEQSLANCHGVESWIKAEKGDNNTNDIQSVFSLEHVASVKVNDWDDIRKAARGEF